MIEVKTGELTGAALDWAVAQIEAEQNEEWCVIARGMTRTVFVIIEPDTGFNYAPSTDWSQGGPLIDKYQVAYLRDGEDYAAVISRMDDEGFGTGSNHLIAACRAIVAAKLGDTVRVPLELTR